MKKIYFLNVLLVLFIALNFAGCKKTDANKEEVSIKYHLATKEELKALVDNESINLGEIDTSKITDMSELFKDSQRDNFTGIENWDVSNVTDMSGMIYRAVMFNQDIGNWDVSNVKDLSFMFTDASSFNQDLSKWNVSNVEYMSGMFMGAESFNQDISKWDVSNVKKMDDMFTYASSFNQDISKWDVSNVEKMNNMFANSPLENNPPAWYKE